MLRNLGALVFDQMGLKIAPKVFRVSVWLRLFAPNRSAFVCFV